VPPELPIPDPPLAAAEVILRPWMPGDAGRLRTVADDALVRRYRASVADLLADPARWITDAEAARTAGERLELAVCLQTDIEHGQPAGSISLWGIHHRNRDALVSWWLGAGGRGRGHGLAALSVVARWGFEELGMERLGASIEEGNDASRRLAERRGFQLEGRLRSYQRLSDGTRVDCLSYSLLPGELRGID
jgi:RimJ/RimL family protein N-acetyltransferase